MSKKKKGRRFTTKTKRLPANFADRVLDLEMQLERNCTSIDSINQLLYLYSVSLICSDLPDIIASSGILQRDE